MLGLMYLGGAAVYFAAVFAAVRWAWRKGRANGGSLLRAGAFATASFVAVYLLVFWNHIPSLVNHRMMCAKDSGLIVHVPADRWHYEHAAQVESERAKTKEAPRQPGTSSQSPDGFSRTTFLSGLLASDIKSEAVDGWGVTLRRMTWRYVDTATGQPPRYGGGLLTRRARGHPDLALQAQLHIATTGRGWPTGQTRLAA